MKMSPAGGGAAAAFCFVLTALPAYLLLSKKPFNREFTPYGDFIQPHQASRRVAIVQYNTLDDWLSQESIRNHKAYADLHGYPYFNFSVRLATEASRPFKDGRLVGSGIFGFDKLAYILDVMIQGLANDSFDWVAWFDGDTLITQPALLLESFLPDGQAFRPDETPHLLMASDHHGLNDGTILFRANWWSISLLAQTIADPYQRHPNITAKFSDQRSMLRVLAENSDLDSHTHHHPRNWLNRDLLPGESNQNNSMQLHLLGKRKRIVKYLKAASRALDDGWDEMRTLQEEGLWEAEVVNRNSAMRLEAAQFWKQAAISRPPLQNWDLSFTTFELVWPYLWIAPALLAGIAVGYVLRLLLTRDKRPHWTRLEDQSEAFSP